MKRFGIGLLVVLGLLALVWVLVPLLVSKEMLQARLESALSARLGRSVAVGDVDFGLRPLPQVRASEIRVGRHGRPGRDEEISARRLDLALAWRPLLRRNVEVVRASVDGLSVDLYLPDAVDPAPREVADSLGTSGRTGGAEAASPATDTAPAAPPSTAPAQTVTTGVGAQGIRVRIESFVLTDASLRAHRGGRLVLELAQVREELRAAIGADGVIEYVGTTSVPTWSFHTPTGTLGDGLPAVLEKSLRFEPSTGTLRLERANLDLAGLPVSVQGTVTGLATAGPSGGSAQPAVVPELDLRFSGGPGRIESIVGLLPSAWVSRTGGLRSSGALAVEGWVRGQAGKEQVPNFALDVALTEGRLEGGDLPVPVEALTAQLVVGPTAIEVRNLSAQAGASKVALRGRVDAYAAVPRLDLAVDGDLDLALVSALQKQAPTETTGLPQPELSGRAAVQAIVRGSLRQGADPARTLEPTGTIVLRGAAVRGIERPVEDLAGRAVVRGSTADLDGVTFRIGESDFAIDGTVANFWVLDPRTFATPAATAANLVVRSRRLDLDALAPPPAPGASPAGSADSPERAGGAETSPEGEGPSGGAASGRAPARGSAETPKVPTGFEVFAAFLSRLEGPLALDAETVRVRQLDWKNVTGRGALARGVIRVDALDLEVFGGRLGANGSVDLRDPKRPLFDLDVAAHQLEAARFFTDSPELARLSGLGGFLQASVDFTADARGALDETFQLDLPTLTSLGNLQLAGGQISGHPVQTALATYLGQTDLQTLPLRDWLQPFRIENGRVVFERVMITAGDFTLSGSGWTSIEGQLQIDLDLLVPANRTAGLRSRLPNVAADVLLGAGNEPVLVPLRLTGPSARPSVQLDEVRLTAQARARAGDLLAAEKEKLEAKVRAEQEEVSRKLEEEARRRARDVIGDILPGAVRDSTGAARADSVAGRVQEEVKGILKGIFR